MASPYQSLGYAQQPLVAGIDDCCGPACVDCCGPACADCCGCVKPGCYSREGACPCFCTKSATTFSFALGALWLAVPTLAIALSLPVFTLKLFDPRLSSAMLLMWQVCGYQPGSGQAGAWQWRCTMYEDPSIDMPGVFGGQDQTFEALRGLAVTSTAFTFVAAILASVRLAAQQRSQPISGTFNGALIAMLVLALGTCTTAFALSFPIFNAFDTYGSDTDAELGGAWICITVGMCLLAFGLLLHLVGHCKYQSSLAQPLGEQPGPYAASPYSAASVSVPVFAHSQPQYLAAAAYPSAESSSTSPAPTHSSMTTAPRAYATVQPLYAR